MDDDDDDDDDDYDDDDDDDDDDDEALNILKQAATVNWLGIYWDFENNTMYTTERVDW